MTTSSPADEKYSGFILFERGYRPFFPGAALFAGAAIPLWIAAINLGMEIPTAYSARAYHVHEMIFGYLGAVLAGFLFTAMPNWTKRPPIVGVHLFFLFTLWLAGRIAMLASAFSPTDASLIDVIFLLTIATIAFREVIRGGSVRNLPVCLLVALFALINVLFHINQFYGNDTAWVERSALSVIAMLISLVAGRVIPNFSTNWMKLHKLSPLPSPFSKYDAAVLVLTIITLVSWIYAPDNRSTGLLFSALFVLHLVRLIRWRGWQTIGEPLVLILHIAYLWLPVWCGLTGLSILAPEFFSATNALHALTAGTIGTMTMAIMTRAILGHSGRPLTAGPLTQIIYLLIFAGTFLRVFADILAIDSLVAISVSGILWAGGFLLFTLVYAPLCVSRKKLSPQ